MLYRKETPYIERWWSRLAVTAKEKISGVSYPGATAWFNSLTDDEKYAVKLRCRK